MNLYEILQINENASEIEIKKAYHKLALLYHPDKNHEEGAKEKFQNIQSAYQILSNSKTRIDYCKMNKIQQYNFVDLLQKIFKNSLVLEEIKHIGVHFEKKDWTYLENNFKELLEKMDFKELMVFYKEGKFKKKHSETSITLSDTDNEEFSESNESYDYLPLCYQKINKLNININLNITLDELINNNKKKIKIKRSINNNIITNSFIFSVDKPYIIFPYCGDTIDNSNGHLIIKLVLPNNFYWLNDTIINEQQITIYEFVYGLNINLLIGSTKIVIPKWIPSRDGFLIDINQIKIKNFNLILKLVISYDHTVEKENLLLKYFS